MLVNIKLSCLSQTRASSQLKDKVHDLTYDEIRHLSVKPLKGNTREPQMWMPPESAVRQLALILECQLEYLLTAGFPGAPTPPFLEKGCLYKCADGTVEYNLGQNVHIDDISEILCKSPDALKRKIEDLTGKNTRKPAVRKVQKQAPGNKRTLEYTPQK